MRALQETCEISFGTTPCPTVRPLIVSASGQRQILLVDKWTRQIKTLGGLFKCKAVLNGSSAGEEGFLREQILEKKGHNMNMYGFSIVLPKFMVTMTGARMSKRTSFLDVKASCDRILQIC